MVSSNAVIILPLIVIVGLQNWECDRIDAYCPQRGVSRPEVLRQALRL